MYLTGKWTFRKTIQYIFMGLLMVWAHENVSFSADANPDVTIDQLIETPWTIRLVRAPDIKERNTSLEFNQNLEFPVLEDQTHQNAYVSIKGKYQQKDHILLWNTNRIVWEETSDTSQKSFSVIVPLKEKLQFIKLTDIGPFGEVAMEKIILEFKDWKTWKDTAGKNIPKRRSSWNISLGPSIVSYQETLEPSFSQTVLTVKGGYQYSLNPKWNIGTSGYLTAFPLSSSDPGRSIRFFGLNFRAGYIIPQIKPPWTLSIMGGLYYTTTFGSAPTLFGFENMYGPQIYPSVKRALSPLSSMGLYFKYALVSSGVSFNPQGTEMATGISYSRLLKNQKTVVVGLDYSKFEIHIGDVFSVSSNTVSLSLGYIW